MDVVEAIHSRRSIRSFESRAIPRDLIKAVLRDAAQAPPPFRGHLPTPWMFHVFEGVDRIAGLGARAKQFARANSREAAPITTEDDFKAFWDAPAVILIAGSAEDCSRAATMLILSVHARGLGACWVGSPMLWLRDAATREELSLFDEPGCALCVGYVKDWPTPTSRPEPVIVWG